MRMWYPILLLPLCLWYCEKPALSREDLNKYVMNPENGLRQVIQKKNITIEMIFRPKDLVIAQEAGLDDPDKWRQAEQQLDSLDYFVLKLSRDGKEIENSYSSDPAVYTKVINYLSNGIESNIRLKTEEDEYAPETIAFAPTFGSATASSALVVFKSDLLHKDGDCIITFDDAMFGTGLSEFKFTVKDLRIVPPLKRAGKE